MVVCNFITFYECGSVHFEKAFDFGDLNGEVRWCLIQLAALIQIPSLPFANSEKLNRINFAPEAQIYLGLQGIYPEITQTIARFA